MLTLTEQRDRSAAVERVIAHLHRHRLAPDDLISVGGEDPEYRRVEAAWALIAREGLTYADLEAHPEFIGFAALPSRKKQKVAAMHGDDLR